MKNNVNKISTIVKGMNYTIPTFKKEGGVVIQGLNTTVKFFNEDKHNSMKQQGVDPRTLILLVARFLKDIDPDDSDFKLSRLYLTKAYETLKDRDIVE